MGMSLLIMISIFPLNSLWDFNPLHRKLQFGTGL